ncbi:fox factor [Moesziomyces aphidis]|uniref:Fox factor n=1 Tax=Moesziomyces aphidis TaxID=84754 RepID=W3VDU0_MOEAP|nr:fox factor [Moesziomyces aphidis]
MLTSLRPRSPPFFDVAARPQPHHITSTLHPAHCGTPAYPSQMEGSGARRYTTPPPGRQAPPYQHTPSHYLADAGPHPLEQRPSPQSRQRSWHHPYMPSPRGAQGPSPPAPLEAGAMPLTRAPDYAPHDPLAHGLRHNTSPSYRSEPLHPAPDARSRASSRAEAQPLSISTLPTHPSRDVERIGGIGPSRNRGRSSTLTLPHPDTARVRGSSFIGARQHTPSHGPVHVKYDEQSPLPPRSWDEGRSFRDGYHNHGGEMYAHRHHSPGLRPSSRESPILFAPLSPSQDPHMQVPRRISGGQHGNPSVMARPGQYRSRPGTPVSPLNMEGLSMEEVSMPSASGMAVPSLHGQGRSPAEARVRNDYFGPAAAADWTRQKHKNGDLAASPPSVSYAPGPRNDPRDYSYRPATVMHGEAISPESEMARYHQASYPVGQPPMHPGRAPGPEPIHHHPSRSRLEQIDRERFAAPHHPVAASPDAYLGAGATQDHGFHAEYTSQPRPRSAGTFVANAPQQNAPVDRIAHSRRRRRPPYSYSSMITQAIASSSEGRMTLREIYTWISSNFSGYPMAGPDSQGWQNTVRHNLSLGKIFIKKARTAQDIYDSCSSGNPSQSQAARGKGGWWTLHPVVLAQIRSGQRTHNDEFDDVERLVETENAAAKEGAVARVAGAAVMAATSSVSSADGRSAPRRSSAEISQHKTLSRQRSYSDSMDPTTVEHRRVGPSQHALTAPVSRKTSIGASRNEANARTAYAPYSSPLSDRRISGSSSDRTRVDMPSVLQTKLGGGANDERVQAFGRFRGHTIGGLESSSPRRSNSMSHAEMDGAGEEAHAHVLMRLQPDVSTSPRAAGRVRAQMVEDVEMEPWAASPRPSSVVLQEARETLANTKQQQQEQMLRQAHEDKVALADAPEGAGRMAIRGLLNS